MPIKKSAISLARQTLIFLPIFCTSLATAAPGYEPPASTPHTPAEETQTIRKHKLKKLEEHLQAEGDAVAPHCRYESEIGNAPPQKKVFLTFDDGPEPLQTEFILSALEKYQVPAAFFMIGEKVKAHPQLVDRVRDSRFAMIGNHSWSHPNFHDLPVPDQALEVEKGMNVLVGLTAQKIFRYPYGNASCETNQLLRALDYKIVGWHVDSCDWAFDRSGTVDARDALICGVFPQHRNDFLEHVVASVRAHNGGIILLHEIHANTLKHLDPLIARLLAEGYSFGKLSEDDVKPNLR